MPSYLKEYSIKSPLYGVLAAVVLLLGVLAYYNWVIALVGLLILAGLFYLTLRMVEKKQREDRRVYNDFILPFKEGG